MDFPMRPHDPSSSPTRGAVAAANGSTAQNPSLSGHLLTRRLKRDLRNDCETPIASVRHWNRPNNAATGQSVTLYERHPHTAEHAGSPIADTFAVVARKNSAVMALGDGVNWGARAALASRCAVHGAVETLNTALFPEDGGPTKVKTTQEVFQCLLRSFHAAHSLILQEEAHLTTLTVCAVLPVREKEGGETTWNYVEALRVEKNVVVTNCFWENRPCSVVPPNSVAVAISARTECRSLLYT